MEPFTKALEVIADIMRDGVATHPDNDWGRWPVDYHLARAEQHLRLPPPTGLEAWFTLPHRATIKPPPRWKM